MVRVIWFNLFFLLFFLSVSGTEEHEGMSFITAEDDRHYEEIPKVRATWKKAAMDQKKFLRRRRTNLWSKFKKAVRCRDDKKRKPGQRCSALCRCEDGSYCTLGFKCSRRPKAHHTRSCSVEKLAGYFSKETYYASSRSDTKKDGVWTVSTVDVTSPPKGPGVDGCRKEDQTWTVYSMEKSCNLVDINVNRDKRMAFVAFRGSTGVCDYLNNMKFVSKVSPGSGLKGKIAKGVRDELDPTQPHICTKIKSLLKTRDVTSVVFTGHSQGGGIAAVSALMTGKCVGKKYRKRLRFISYLLPRVGNSKFWSQTRHYVDDRRSYIYDTYKWCAITYKYDWAFNIPGWLNHPPVKKRYIKCSGVKGCGCHKKILYGDMWTKT